MGDTLRQQIMDRIRARFAGIRTAAGYGTDIGAHVFEWKISPFQEPDIPGVAVRDPDDEKEAASGSRTRHRLMVEATAVVSGDLGDVPAQMRDAIEDLQAAVAVDEKWGLGDQDAQGRHVLSTDPLADESSEVVQEGKRFGIVKMTIAVNYMTNKWGA